MDVPPQTNPVPVSWGQPDGKAVPDPLQPPVERLVISLQTQLGARRVGRAVGEGHPGSGDDHADVHTQSHPKERRHGAAVLQGPVLLAAI